MNYTFTLFCIHCFFLFFFHDYINIAISYSSVILRSCFKSLSTFCLYSLSLASSLSRASSLAFRTVVSVLLEVAFVLTLTSDSKSSDFLVAQNLSAMAFSFLTLCSKKKKKTLSASNNRMRPKPVVNLNCLAECKTKSKSSSRLEKKKQSEVFSYLCPGLRHLHLI